MFSLASPLLVIIFTMMMMPSGGATNVFSGKDADIPFFLVKAQSRAHATPSPHSRAVAGPLQGSPVTGELLRVLHAEWRQARRPLRRSMDRYECHRLLHYRWHARRREDAAHYRWRPDRRRCCPPEEAQDLPMLRKKLTTEAQVAFSFSIAASVPDRFGAKCRLPDEASRTLARKCFSLFGCGWYVWCIRMCCIW